VSTRETHGVVIGRFMPPHAGHRYLVDFARFMADRVSVLVCTLSHEPIPGELRYRWVGELFPDVERVHITEEIPEARRGSPNAVAIWAETVRERVEGAVDYVFASEDYGFELADHLEASFVPVDPSRSAFPVSASGIRNDPKRYWRFIPEPVRPYFVSRVCLLSADRELAGELSQRFDTVHAADYAQYWERAYGRAPHTLAEQDAVIQGQHALEAALARQSNWVLFTEMDPQLIELRMGEDASEDGGTGNDSRLSRSPSALQSARAVAATAYDLYLLDADLTETELGRLPERYTRLLETQECDVVSLRGSREEKLDIAAKAVEALSPSSLTG
jgi:NadR type nicotinamide-nucleotide adenylyltransferase